VRYKRCLLNVHADNINHQSLAAEKGKALTI
jgi:hypothetical protein